MHAYCYYSGEEYDDERMLSSKVGPQLIRSKDRIPADEVQSNEDFAATKIYEERFLTYHQGRIERGSKILMSPLEDPVLIEMKEQYADAKTAEIQKDSKYLCKICEKMFMGKDFVKKHIGMKHSEQMSDKFNKARFETMLRESYRSDPNKFTNQPTQNPHTYYSDRGFGGRGRFQGPGGFNRGGRGDHRGGRGG